MNLTKMNYQISSLLLISLMATSPAALAKSATSRKPTAVSSQVVTKEGIEFVETNSPSYHDKVDLADLEYRHPLNPAALRALTPEKLAKFSEEELDQLYARLTAGPIPDGAYHGSIVFEKDGGLQGMARSFAKDGRGGLIDFGFNELKAFGEYMWKGKHFYHDQGVLRNLIPKDWVHRVLIDVIVKPLLHTSPKPNQFVQTQVDGKPFYEIFPAKLYCGQSLLDSRRESVVIDYNYTQDLPGYQPEVDVLAGGKGLAVRDEIRMIRPGFYLGRAYMQKVFGLIFVLYNEAADKAGDSHEECWIGTQHRS